MSEPQHEAWVVEENEVVRPYAVTGGRTRPSQNLDLSSYLKIRRHPGRAAAVEPEARQILAVCRAGPVPVAEIAGRTGHPVQVTKILVADLLDAQVLIHAMPNTAVDRPDVQLLQEVLDGLQRFRDAA